MEKEIMYVDVMFEEDGVMVRGYVPFHELKNQLLDVPDTDTDPDTDTPKVKLWFVQSVANGSRAKIREEPDKGLSEMRNGFMYQGDLIEVLEVTEAQDEKWWLIKIFNSWDEKTIGITGWVRQSDAVIQDA